MCMINKNITVIITMLYGSHYEKPHCRIHNLIRLKPAYLATMNNKKT